jgi:hypothetical protein
MSVGLNLEVEPQQGDLLCWAAVAASIARFYNPQSPWTQCGIANQILHSTACCHSMPSCNQESFLESALQATAHLATPPVFRLTFQQVRDELDRQRPIGIRIAFSISVGHFVAVCGYNDAIVGEETVTLSDPTGLNHDVLYADLLQPGGYPGGGMWTHSYFTQP